MKDAAAQLGIELQVQSEALDRCPGLEDALAFVLDAYDDNPDVAKGDFGRGQRFSIAQLPGLGLLHWAPYGILLKLPGELDGWGDKRTSNGPAILNLCTVDMRHSLTTSTWGLRGAHESTVLESLRSIELTFQPYNHHFRRRPVLYLPVVVIVGDTHVNHTYVTDEDKGLALQSTGIGSFIGEAV